MLLSPPILCEKAQVSDLETFLQNLPFSPDVTVWPWVASL